MFAAVVFIDCAINKQMRDKVTQRHDCKSLLKTIMLNLKYTCMAYVDTLYA